MNTSEQIVQRLGRLAPEDREWILRRLSPGVRTALIAGPGSARESGARDPSASEPIQNRAAVRDVDARGVAASLAAEPAWVAHAVLQRHAAWREEVLRMLPAALRSDMDRLTAAGVRYSDKLIDFLLSRLGNDAAPEALSEPSAFDKLVGTLSSRLARKRMRIRA